MKEKSKSEVSIIGGADGPTSIFIAGRTRKRPLKVRIRNIIYRFRRKIVEKKVVADAHTLDELVQYAMSRYNLIETNSTERKYLEQRKNLKESLILQHKPEVLGEMKDIPKPDISNEESVREYFCKIRARSEMIAEIKPISIPSTINGQRTNQFVAPTDFIMLISRRLLNIVIRIVFEIIKSETTSSRAIMPALI